MIEIAMMMAQAIPFEDKVKDLEKALVDYNDNPTKSNKDSVTAAATMIVFGDITQSVGLSNVLEQIKEQRDTEK